MDKKASRSLVLLAALFLIYATANSAPAASFYEGKTIRIVVGFSAGGGFDTYTRLIARHLGKYVPGNPTIVVQNMPGAGSLVAANYIYNKAKPDGLIFGTWVGGLILQQILGSQGVQFDARKFQWIGAPVMDSHACALTTASGITSVERWFAAKEPVKIGATAPGSTTSDIPKLLKATLGLPIQVVEGYGGTSRIRLAAEAGEVAGGCWTWDSIKSTWRQRLDSNEVKVVLQINPERHPDLRDVPNAIEFAKSGEDRRLIDVAIHKTGMILRSYSLPPGTPEDRVNTLQQAFAAAMKDPELLEEARKSQLSIHPLGAEEVKRLVDSYFELTPGEVSRLQQILVPK